jgi:signal transduction histidine kinase
VQDHGPGIPPEDREKIFSAFHQIETFFTGQVDGWGLGLPYIKKVVESHGGKIELESALGSGSTFCVTLPRRA